MTHLVLTIHEKRIDFRSSDGKGNDHMGSDATPNPSIRAERLEYLLGYFRSLSPDMTVEILLG